MGCIFSAGSQVRKRNYIDSGLFVLIASKRKVSNNKYHLWISSVCQVFCVYSLCHVDHPTVLQGRYYPILKMRKPRLREFNKLPEVTQVITSRLGIKPRSVKFQRSYSFHCTVLFLHSFRLQPLFIEHFLCARCCTTCFTFNLEVGVFPVLWMRKEAQLIYQRDTTSQWNLGCHLQSTCSSRDNSASPR